jgi:hypothetical protein
MRFVTKVPSICAVGPDAALGDGPEEGQGERMSVRQHVATVVNRKDGRLPSLASTLTELKIRWQASGTSIREGAPLRAIEAFENRYAVILPSDFAEYLQTVDGMNPGETDERLVRFWKLDELRPAHEGRFPVPETFTGYFLFADYPLGEQGYAIRLLLGGNEVVLLGARPPTHVAASFSEFLAGYMRGARATLFGRGQS